MQRREFLQTLGWGLAVALLPGAVGARQESEGGIAPLRLTCLADAHLRDGRDSRAEAQALARAVAEVRALSPRPDLVLFAGDLATGGDAGALALGREMLQDLPAPLLAVPGEEDGPERGRWTRLFGSPRFCRRLPGLQIIGLDTGPASGTDGEIFAVGREQRTWLAETLSRLSPDLPLVVLTHAPLTPLYHPWRQWTGDGRDILSLLRSFPKVLCLHGHVHRPGKESRPVSEVADTAEREIPQHGLPATSWPLPWPVMGTPARLSPSPGSTGCGWSLLTVTGGRVHHQARLWDA